MRKATKSRSRTRSKLSLNCLSLYIYFCLSFLVLDADIKFSIYIFRTLRKFSSFIPMTNIMRHEKRIRARIKAILCFTTFSKLAITRRAYSTFFLYCTRISRIFLSFSRTAHYRRVNFLFLLFLLPFIYILYTGRSQKRRK